VKRQDAVQERVDGLTVGQGARTSRTGSVLTILFVSTRLRSSGPRLQYLLPDQPHIPTGRRTMQFQIRI
jgi:hypothetical protein